MNNFGKSERSKGVLVFASNTSQTDYVSMARKTAAMAANILGIDQLVVTPDTQEFWKNSRLDPDTKEYVPWNNHSRWQAYQCSPWDDTLLIDADYLVTTNKLNLLFETASDYLLCHNNSMLTPDHSIHTGLPPIWATVVFFRKSEKSRLLFDTVRRIENNYAYYREVFNVQSRNFRNDYAFSMADLIINGHQRDPAHAMPWGIVTANSMVNSIDINDDWMVVRGEEQAHILPRQDLHVMSKGWFSSLDFDSFVSKI